MKVPNDFQVGDVIYFVPDEEWHPALGLIIDVNRLKVFVFNIDENTFDPVFELRTFDDLEHQVKRKVDRLNWSLMIMKNDWNGRIIGEE